MVYLPPISDSQFQHPLHPLSWVLYLVQEVESNVLVLFYVGQQMGGETETEHSTLQRFESLYQTFGPPLNVYFRLSNGP